MKWQRVPQKVTQNIHDCAYDTCVLVIRTLTLPVSLHCFHSQHPLSAGTESVSQLPPRFLTNIIIAELEGLD